MTPHPSPLPPVVIRPVILAVAAENSWLTMRLRVRELSLLAREAVRLSARKSHAGEPAMEKDAQGVPLACDGVFWSLTHKPAFVGGVTAPGPVGIDIECIRPCSPALQRKVADDDEWAMGRHDPPQRRFFRYWTAKEAALKATGAGIRELGQCRVQQVVDARRLTLWYRGRHWRIEQLFFDGHVAAVVCEPSWRVRWALVRAKGLGVRAKGLGVRG